LSREDVRESETEVDVAVDLVPGVDVGFLANVVSGRTRGIANDGAARGVIERVSRAGQPEIQPLARHSPAAVGLDSDAGANRLDVLPAELIADTETIVRGWIHGVESAVHTVFGILV